MLAFYKQTWWLWLLFLAVFVMLSIYVHVLFVVMIPGIVAYSVYFGVVRTSELKELQAQQRAEAEAHRRATAVGQSGPLP